MKSHHILNGDALKNQFPTDEIAGEVRVTKECLVDGPVNGGSLEEFLHIRASFIREAYGDSDEKYKHEVIPEINRIVGIEDGVVHLWFEDDLFCQVNLWFVCSLLYTKNVRVHLVRPKKSLRYGFGALNKTELIEAYNQKKLLTPIHVNQFAILWFNYQKQSIERLLKLSVQVYEDFPFVKEAVIAHVERDSIDGKPGRPEQAILNIINEKSTTDFSVVFQEFCKREPIYGFGDLQVKRIFDALMKKHF